MSPEGRRQRSPPVRVLMVCTGNICRSPTAEGVLRSLAQAAGWGERLVVDSAGTTRFHVGEAPDGRSQAHARRRGVELGGQRARQLVAEDFTHFDWLLAMDRGHLDTLLRLCPPARRDRVRLLLDFSVDHAGAEVPDPYDGGADGFEQVLDLVESGCRGLLRHLAERA